MSFEMHIAAAKFAPDTKSLRVVRTLPTNRDPAFGFAGLIKTIPAFRPSLDLIRKGNSHKRAMERN